MATGTLIAATDTLSTRISDAADGLLPSPSLGKRSFEGREGTPDCARYSQSLSGCGENPGSKLSKSQVALPQRSLETVNASHPHLNRFNHHSSSSQQPGGDGDTLRTLTYSARVFLEKRSFHHRLQSRLRHSHSIFRIRHCRPRCAPSMTSAHHYHRLSSHPGASPLLLGAQSLFMLLETELRQRKSTETRRCG